VVKGMRTKERRGGGRYRERGDGGMMYGGGAEGERVRRRIAVNDLTGERRLGEDFW